MSISLRNLGRSDIKVSPIGLGGNQFSGRRSYYRLFGKDISQDETNRIIQAALRAGINWFDTAEVYGGGHSESAIAAGLNAAGKATHEVIIGTKWFPLLRSAKNIKRTINKRLDYLAGYAIDVYMIHNTWGFSSVEAEMAAMADLVAAGKIRSIGVSNFNREQMIRAEQELQKRGLSLVANQVQFSLLNRSIEADGTLQAAKELGISIIAYYPLGSGILSGKYHKNPELFSRVPLLQRYSLQREYRRSMKLIQILGELARQRSVTPAQIALNWVINYHGDIIVAIPGATGVEQVQENAGTMNFTLSKDELDLLATISRDFR